MSEKIKAGDQCTAVWRRMASFDPDINFADRVLADRGANRDAQCEVIAEDALGNITFRCTRRDTQLVDLDVAMPSGIRRVPLCATHYDIPKLWQAEREAAGG